MLRNDGGDSSRVMGLLGRAMGRVAVGPWACRRNCACGKPML